MKKYHGMAIVALTTATLVQALPKYQTHGKEPVLSKGDFFQVNGDQLAMESTSAGNVTEKLAQEATQDRPPRFGFPTYTTDVQPVGNALPGLYGPVKLDIGGLVLGTIVGLGAFFILPKLFHVVSAPYGPYKRSEEAGDGGNGLADLLTRVQESLNSYNIDSTACLQRAICLSVQSAGEKTGNKTANSFESAVDSMAKNDIVKTIIDGTEWKKAVDAAEKGEDCTSTFSKCPVEVDTIISAITKYLMS